MKNVLIITISALLILSGTALAEDPVQGWVDVMEDMPVTTGGLATEYGTAHGAVLNVVSASDGRIRETRIRKHRAMDGEVLVQIAKEAYGRNTVAKAICLGDDGDFVTTGYHDNGSNPVFWTAGWEAEGDSMAWVREVFSASDTMEQGLYISRDDEGNYYAVGTTWNVETGADVTVIKYNSLLEQQWRKTFEEDGVDSPYGIVKMDSEYITVVAEKSHEGSFQPFTLPWNRNDGSIDDPSRVFYGAKMVDTDDVLPAGDVYKRSWKYHAADDTCFYIAATVVNSSGSDIWTACCDYEGNYLWEKTFDSGHDDEVKDICMGFGYVYVVGSSENGTDKDARMIRYDEAGNETWNVVYDNGKDEALNAICLDPAGNFYVSGYIKEDTVGNALLIKYNQPDVVGVEEQCIQSPVTLEITDNLTSTPIIHYSLPAGQSGTLAFYSADGRKLESHILDPAKSAFTWPSDNSYGVYFARLSAVNKSVTQKIILTK